MPKDPENDPKVLRKRNEQLERELALAQDVIALLRELPGNREPPKGSSTRPKTKRTGKKKADRPASSPPSKEGGDVSPDAGPTQKG